MERPFSTSKVTVEYHDPHDIYKLLAPGLIPRLPLRDLHWRSPTRPLRSIHTLHVELAPPRADPSSAVSPLASPSPEFLGLQRSESATSQDDGFHTASFGGQIRSTDQVDVPTSSLRPPGAGKERRHQIPGLRRTPYLKVLLIRCDDNETYKSKTRAEIRDWIKVQTALSGSSKKSNKAENHDAFEWLVIHVVLPNTAAATQPRVTGAKGSSDSNLDTSAKSNATSRWRGGPSTLLEKLRSDFNTSSKNPTDRIAQIRIGINDVPYDVLPRVVPAVPTGYQETVQDAENAWSDLVSKFKSLILSSFDMRVSQYEEDIKERDAQRTLPGWNFCTFFILKEGLARGFESVGLVEDALIGYDELSVGLDTVVQEQAVVTGSAEAHGGSLLSFTKDLKDLAQKCVAQVSAGNMDFADEEAVDLQSTNKQPDDKFGEIPIASTKKPYRDLILANNVSVYDFRCYIFARQISLLLRLGNAWSTREELLAKLKEQQESVLHGVAPQAPPPKPTDEAENLSMLAEICRRTLEFIPAVSQVMRRDIISAMTAKGQPGEEKPRSELPLDPALLETIDNIVASFAFSVAQQILAQTSTKALPIPPSTLASSDAHEPKAAIPEPKTMMHPARSSSLHVRPGVPTRGPPSPGIFPGPGRRASGPEIDAVHSQFLKDGLEALAAQRAELYTLCRNVHEECGKRRGWSDGWDSIPIVGETGVIAFDDVSLADDDNDDDKDSDNDDTKAKSAPNSPRPVATSLAGIDNELLRTALDNKEDFYRLYETLTDKALRHYTVANHAHSVQSNMADLAVLKFHLGEYGPAASYFYRTTPFYGESGWNLVELSMLVMYSRCLRELQRKDEYAKVLLKLLSKAAAAEMDKMQQRSSIRIKHESRQQYPEPSAISGLLGELLAVSGSLEKEIRAPLANFFCHVGLDDAPVHDQDQDGFSVVLHLRSLLTDDLEAREARLRLASPTAAGDKEVWLQTDGPMTLRPGSNSVQLCSNTIIPGDYEVQEIILSSSNLTLQFERSFGQPVDKFLTMLRNPRVTIYQRASCLDVRLAAAKDVQLDRNNSLELEVLTGWNEITNCEVRIKCATGGLRLIMNEAKVLGPYQPTGTPEGGCFTFGAVPANSSINITFPFSVEQDLLNVSVRAEVTYTTERGSFGFCKTSSVPIALALGVNVQDVFKHNALFSRFTVSTATSSPLRLFKSDLVGSDLFESHFGSPPSNTVMIFPKQPASLLYKVTRKPGSATSPKMQKTMYLKLCYSVLSDEIQNLVQQSLKRSLEGTALWEYSPLVLSSVTARLQQDLSEYDLQRSALLGELRTSFLSDVKWTKYFVGLGKSSGSDVAAALSDFIQTWQKTHQTMAIPPPHPASGELKSILIPVDIPSINIVHTADIRLQENETSLVSADPLIGTSTVCINQLMPATLHLKWTRTWDTGDSASPAGNPPVAMGDDIEFSYEVTAPTDTWLLGGRRKGHFVIPAVSDDTGDPARLSSTPDTEADIALLLVPLREGWLPYPNVEIREVRQATAAGSGDADASPGGVHCETDYRNLGETVRVIADRAKVTLSLDASGPGGGPLILESQLLGLGGRVVA